MSAVDSTVAHVDIGHDDSVRTELVHQEAYRCNISYSVHSSDLMEVHLSHRDAVSLALGICYYLIDRKSILPDLLIGIDVIHDDMLYIAHSIMMVSVPVCMLMFMAVRHPVLVRMLMTVLMLMCMSVRELFVSIDENTYMCARNAAFLRVFS